MRGKMTLFILSVIMMFGMCGCMSKEDDEQLKKITKEALTYVEEKYQENFSVKGSGYVLIDTTLFPTYGEEII